MPLSSQFPDDLHTGLPALDDEHRKIHRMLVGLHQTLEGGCWGGELRERVRQIEQLVAVHFAEEEALMEQVGYPHLGPHRADHHAQVERMHELTLRFQAVDAPPLADLVVQVVDLLLEHVRIVDLDFARWEQMRRLEMR